jgi:hypothetical protein
MEHLRRYLGQESKLGNTIYEFGVWSTEPHTLPQSVQILYAGTSSLCPHQHLNAYKHCYSTRRYYAVPNDMQKPSKLVQSAMLLSYTRERHKRETLNTWQHNTYVTATWPLRLSLTYRKVAWLVYSSVLIFTIQNLKKKLEKFYI